MMKMQYLRHPIKTSTAAMSLLAARTSMLRFAMRGERYFRGDARYNLQNVTEGFISRIDDSSDDTELLERICAAYIRSVERQEAAPEIYRATRWWQQVRQRSLSPVLQALLTRDISALKRMYRNFFRDPCSTGLLTVPYGMSKAYFSGEIKDIHRSFYLSLVLHRLDYWTTQTDGRFELSDLASPMIGNPFGVQIEGTHIRVGAEYAHYCAHRVNQLLKDEIATVAEIGGGFGGMAYYLLRDRARVTYLDFDVPEGIALTSYYLLKALPQLKYLLYGEDEMTKEAIGRVDVVLMPVCELSIVPPGSVDVTFSSHAMSDISSEAMVEYLSNIDRMTTGCFLHIGNRRASRSISDVVSQKDISLELTETRSSEWHRHKAFGTGVSGTVYDEASTILEQRYTRTTLKEEQGERTR